MSKIVDARATLTETTLKKSVNDDDKARASSTRSMGVANSTMPLPQPPRNSTPTTDAVTVPSAPLPLPLGSLVDFQDRIILLAVQIAVAGDGKHDIMGSIIIDKICADAVAQRVVEAYHRQNKSAEQTIESLKNLYMTT